jgi:hypothetical protein
LSAFEKLFSDNPQTWHQVADTLFQNTVPQSLVPTTLQLGVELFTGSRVGAVSQGLAGIPEYLKPVDPEDQTAPWVSDSSYAMSKMLTTLGIPGASPLKVENVLTGYTGGLGTLIVDAPKWWDLASGQGKAEFTPGRLPVVRVFLAKNPGFSSRSITRAYDLLNELEGFEQGAQAVVRSAKNATITPEDAAERITTGEPKYAFGVGTKTAVSDFRKALSDARVMWNRINSDESLTLVDRRIKMDEWVELMVGASDTFYNSVTGVASKLGVSAGEK